MDKKDISKRIKEGLELRNMSQQELCNCSVITIITSMLHINCRGVLAGNIKII